MRTTVALVGAVAVFAAGVAVGSTGGGSGEPDRDRGPVALPDRLELVGSLSSFEACDDYLAHVREQALDLVTPYGLGGGPMWGGEEFRLDGAGRAAGDDAATEEGEMAAGSADMAPAAPTSGTVPDDVSGTNVQEQDVDEPDLVKTDGEVLYTVAGDRLRVVDISGDTPEQIAEVPLQQEGGGGELLLAGDRLLLTSAHGGFIPFAGERVGGDLLPTSGATTTLTAIDVADPSAPEVVERLVLDGATISARMVEGVARVVIRTEPGVNLPWEHPEAGGLRSEREALAANQALIRDSEAEDWLPYYVHETASGERQEGTLVPCERVARPDEFAGLGLLSVLTVDVDTGALLPTAGAVGVLAGGDTVYASTERLYVATQRWRDDLGGGVTTADPDTSRFPGPEDGPDVTTELHAFAIDDPRATEYLGSGAVDGTLLSQWALSEHDGVLRVASTVGDPWSAASSESSVTTLELRDGELVPLGRVDGLGPTETIRAVRFIGDVGYVVTFRQTDPLYTVDLSDPAAPAVVGELKIPGYSGYLHPVGDGRLIGVGQDADEEGMTLGVQVSLFDVSDPADPRRTDTVTLPDSESPVEWDHRSFLHWPATGLTVVPVTRHFWGPMGSTAEPIEDETVPEPEGPSSGALALVPEGDTLRAAADHAPDELVLNHADAPPPDATAEELARAFDGGYEAAILRSVVTGDRLVTVSHRGVIVHDLATLADRGTLGF